MSTASKVLTALVILAMAGWVVLIAAVATLNEGYGKKVEELDKQIVQREEQFAKAKDDLAAAKREHVALERRNDRAVSDSQAKREHATSLLSMSTETQTRLSHQLKAMEAAEADATKNREFRKQELAGLRTEIEKKKSESAEVQKLNAEKRQKLGELQAQFKQAADANRSGS